MKRKGERVRRRRRKRLPSPTQQRATAATAPYEKRGYEPHIRIVEEKGDLEQNLAQAQMLSARSAGLSANFSSSCWLLPRPSTINVRQ